LPRWRPERHGREERGRDRRDGVVGVLGCRRHRGARELADLAALHWHRERLVGGADGGRVDHGYSFVSWVSAAGGGPCSSSATSPASSRRSTPSCSAFASLEPGFAPTTT